MLTLQQLITPVTEDEALATILDVLGQLGFQSTSWAPNAFGRVTARLAARIWSQVTTIVSEIASGGFTGLATGGWLTLVAKHFYEVDRIEASKTIGQFTLTASAGAPVNTWSAGDIIVADAPIGSANANSFTCTAGGSLGPGTDLSLEFSADVAGAAANIATGATLYLWTPLVGVTVTNPAYGTSTTWITTVGLDEESDTRLAQRCTLKWSALTYGNINGAYEYWALSALPTLTRVSIAGAAGDGTITIIGATSLGPITAGDCTTIEDYVNGVTDGTGRRPLNDIVSAVPATTLAPTYTPTLNVTPAVYATIAATVQVALATYVGTIPIGGLKLVTLTSGVVPFSRLVQVAQDVPGVRSLSGFPTSDIALGSTEIFTPTFNFTVNQVAPGA